MSIACASRRLQVQLIDIETVDIVVSLSNSRIISSSIAFERSVTNK